MRVKVWNDNKTTDWVETFKGDQIRIPAGGFIEMEFYEAYEFRGQFSAIRILGDGTHDPKSSKMIRVEPLTQERKDELEDDQEVFPCNLCKKVYASSEALAAHSEKMHSGSIVVDDEAEQAIPKKRGRPFKQKEVNAHD